MGALNVPLISMSANHTKGEMVTKPKSTSQSQTTRSTHDVGKDRLRLAVEGPYLDKEFNEFLTALRVSLKNNYITYKRALVKNINFLRVVLMTNGNFKEKRIVANVNDCDVDRCLQVCLSNLQFKRASELDVIIEKVKRVIPEDTQLLGELKKAKLLHFLELIFNQKFLRHEGHEDHVLTLMQREAFFKCDACREEAKDTSYKCIAISNDSVPSATNEFTPCNIEANGIDNEPDLVEFPLLDEESIFDFIIAQCGKFEVHFQGEGENSFTVSTTSTCPHIIDEHWSHKNHPLEQLHFTLSDIDSDDDSDDRKVLICDGCIQPITVSRPSYYACIQCGFYLHSFCASKLPKVLPAGASLFHPQHSLLLQKRDKFYSFVSCEVCGYFTNGFYYHCDTCDINIDIRCIFLPTRIKHRSHKNHTLVQRPFSNSVCCVVKIRITFGVEYAYETCSNFQINILSAFYPSRMKHKYEIHPLTLRHPPFFYEGVFYCEICEEQVNNQLWLYHCGECDHSFHCDCLRWYESIKLGGTIELPFSNQTHTLALVLKKAPRKNLPPYVCGNCGHSYRLKILFECDGCSLLICRNCVIEILGE
ncbi:uncharacterized protein LOC141708606 [Apium graveolens]|uniref:uncharacterized protein LOC141708606 n=1 Tax=Apium graveolens TaxID=4045 RepID=UPI003D79B651